MVYNKYPKIDLNNYPAAISCNAELNKNQFGDTTLRLECLGYGGSKSAPEDGCRLVLGLGPTPSVYSNEYCSAGINSNKKPVIGSYGELCEGDSVLELGLSHHFSSSKSDLNPSSNHQSVCTEGSNIFGIGMPVVDEGSTSAKKSGGYMPSLILAPRMSTTSKNLPQKRKLFEILEKPHHGFASDQLSSERSVVSDYSNGVASDLQTGNSKKCRFAGCKKGARGQTALCIGHGGGQRCQKPGCNKGAESRAAYCKAHGGGKRCHHLGCMKSAEGQTEYCIAHGGGRRCSYLTGCSKAARGKSGLCIKHGGGKRCVVEGCTRSAEGQVGLCISHGGGRRCRFEGCGKGAQGSTTYCKAHGGGKRCVFAGCTKGAEGSTPLCKVHGGGRRCMYEGGGICPKSVHGGTNFCVAHGGGKRCDVAGCTKSARGRTNCCVKHGGGKRCKFEKCTKSAQGSTDFCKAHGGGKRCIWGGEGKCEKFARGRGGLCAAHGSMVQESEGSKKKGGGVGIGSQLFHGIVSGPPDNYSLSGVSVVSNSGNWLEDPARNRQLIPPQVLVPSSMKSLAFSLSTRERGSDQKEGKDGGLKGLEEVVPEGRVHGGGLLLLMGGNLRDAVIDGI
ncbi:hypothetical protein L6452_22764 [Arctium lappa]|uniref:Uncharacterized protein n=1 Tax=Arctium lappa TaxID=4217 RepID=A0ACB9AZV2_ARCLA|nr:hypothetical protein L6452_22764 [Arctium lappa]